VLLAASMAPESRKGRVVGEVMSGVSSRARPRLPLMGLAAALLDIGVTTRPAGPCS
jgi:hypothetical protein